MHIHLKHLPVKKSLTCHMAGDDVLLKSWKIITVIKIAKVLQQTKTKA